MNQSLRERFDSLRAELLEKGELTLKHIMHDGKEVPSIRLIVKGKRWLVEEIVEVKDGNISRRARTISPKRGENYIWTHLPSIQSNKEERV